jgi:hypothetical protein
VSASTFIRVGNRMLNLDRVNELEFVLKGTTEGGRELGQDRLRLWFGPDDCSTLFGDEAIAVFDVIVATQSVVES